MAFAASVVVPPPVPPLEAADEAGALEAAALPDELALEAGAALLDGAALLLDGALEAPPAAELAAELDEELDELLDELLLDPEPVLEPHAETMRATAARPATAPIRPNAARV